MSQENIPYTVVDWDLIKETTHPGESGLAIWRTLQFAGLRVRIVEYSAGYVADHWCQKGHIVHCLEGEFITEQENGESMKLKKGMSYIVSDELSSHRSIAKRAVKLLIIDGDFLKYQDIDQLSLSNDFSG
jgi:hypothetical protein